MGPLDVVTRRKCVLQDEHVTGCQAMEHLVDGTMHDTWSANTRGYVRVVSEPIWSCPRGQSANHLVMSTWSDKPCGQAQEDVAQPCWTPLCTDHYRVQGGQTGGQHRNQSPGLRRGDWVKGDLLRRCYRVKRERSSRCSSERTHPFIEEGHNDTQR